MLTAPTDLRVHLSTLLVGLHWLYDTEQPAGATVALRDGGQALASSGGWRFTFVPVGPTGAPMVVVDSGFGDRLSRGAIEQLGEDIDDFGITVSRTSLAGDRGVIELAVQAHPSLLRAITSAPAGPAAAAQAVALIDLRRQAQPGLASDGGRARQRRAVHRDGRSAAPAGLRLRCPHRRP